MEHHDDVSGHPLLQQRLDVLLLSGPVVHPLGPRHLLVHDPHEVGPGDDAHGPATFHHGKEPLAAFDDECADLAHRRFGPDELDVADHVVLHPGIAQTMPLGPAHHLPRDHAHGPAVSGLDDRRVDAVAVQGLGRLVDGGIHLQGYDREGHDVPGSDTGPGLLLDDIDEHRFDAVQRTVPDGCRRRGGVPAATEPGRHLRRIDLGHRAARHEVDPLRHESDSERGVHLEHTPELVHEHGKVFHIGSGLGPGDQHVDAAHVEDVGILDELIQNIHLLGTEFPGQGMGHGLHVCAPAQQVRQGHAVLGAGGGEQERARVLEDAHGQDGGLLGCGRNTFPLEDLDHQGTVGPVLPAELDGLCNVVGGRGWWS